MRRRLCIAGCNPPMVNRDIADPRRDLDYLAAYEQLRKLTPSNSGRAGRLASVFSARGRSRAEKPDFSRQDL